MSLATLQELRAFVAPRRKSVLPCSDFPSGVPRGALTQVSGPEGSGKTSFVLRLIAENTRLHVAWVEERFTAYPRAFEQLGIQLGRVLFAEASDQALWTAQQMLRSHIFGIVVLSTRQLEQIDLRRLQLSAEQANASIILLSETPTLQGAWPISLQLEVRDGNIRRLK